MGDSDSDYTRREFLSGSVLATLVATLGTEIPFGRFFPADLTPVAYAASDELAGLTGTDGLTVMSDRPLNAETPPHLLDDEITPTNHLFIRNNGIVPEIAKHGDAKGWTLTVDGEVKKTLQLTLEDLRSKYKAYTYQLVLECAGNGRGAFYPTVPGNQWTYGGVGCPLWTGVRLKDVLKDAELKPTAIYTGYYGHDVHLSGDPNKVVISRGTPIEKALDDYTLIAFELNGKPLPAVHGFPARLLCPGYPASTSG
jgi:DMSO/TMAO reductase YedYZ molybdopterin-dependent catalytic subunit